MNKESNKLALEYLKTTDLHPTTTITNNLCLY